MTTLDPWGITGAAKPWDSLDAKQPAKKANTRDPQSAVDRCLGCTVPAQKCRGACRSPRRPYHRRQGANPPGRPKEQNSSQN